VIRIPIQSSALISVGYDSDSQLLQVEFNDGRIYDYFDVPASVHTEWMRSESKGQFFNATFRGRFRYRCESVTGE
jgi:KTSC domain